MRFLVRMEVRVILQLGVPTWEVQPSFSKVMQIMSWWWAMRENFFFGRGHPILVRFIKHSVNQLM